MLSNVHINCFWGEKKGGKSDITNTPPKQTVSRCGCDQWQWRAFQRGQVAPKRYFPRRFTPSETWTTTARPRRSGISEQQAVTGKKWPKKTYAETPPQKRPPMVSPNKHTTREAESGTSSTVLGYANFALQCQSRWSSNQIETQGIVGKKSTTTLWTSDFRKSIQIISNHLYTYMCIWNVGESLSKLFRQQIRRTHLYLSRLWNLNLIHGVTWFTWLPCWLVPDFSAFDFHDSPFFTTMILTPWSQSNRICPAGQWPNSL